MRVERVRGKIIYAIWLAESTRHEISTMQGAQSLKARAAKEFIYIIHEIS